MDSLSEVLLELFVHVAMLMLRALIGDWLEQNRGPSLLAVVSCSAKAVSQIYLRG